MVNQLDGHVCELESSRVQLRQTKLHLDEAHRSMAARSVAESVILSVALGELRHAEHDAESHRRAVQRVLCTVAAI